MDYINEHRDNSMICVISLESFVKIRKSQMLGRFSEFDMFIKMFGLIKEVRSTDKLDV